MAEQASANSATNFATSPGGSQSTSMSSTRRLTTTPTSLKRPRSDFKLPKSPQSSKPSFAKIPRYESDFVLAPLTGAAAFAHEREMREGQTKSFSENPANRALRSLISSPSLAMSRPTDAPLATVPATGSVSIATSSTNIPKSPLRSRDNPETSPASGVTAKTSTSVSPAGIISTLSRSHTSAGPHLEPDNRSAFSYSSHPYTGQAVAAAELREPLSRGMSYPTPAGPAAAQPPNRSSTSQKKHKCPYCDTEFTRHHNLKSHLLTHSQEKPYVCTTCEMRFRRLHDLKRHTKLHTGERPHKCPKCDRKFARGDALARHAKGQGGCAGRRPSVEGYGDGEGGEDDYEGSPETGSGMEGIVYAEPEQTTDLSDEDPRRASLPSIQAQHVSHTPRETLYPSSRSSNTYPPAGPRQRANTGNSLYVPGQEPINSSSTSSGGSHSILNVSGHSANTSISSTIQSTVGYMGGNMTESPKPLSPSGMVSYQLGHDNNTSRQRSPSLSTQFQHQHLIRQDSARTSPHINLPSPHSQGPKLPSLSGLAPPPSSSPYPLISPSNLYPHSISQGPTYQPQMIATGPSQMISNTVGTVSSSVHKSSNSRDSTNNLFSNENNMWPYVQSLESKIRQLNERVFALETSERNSLERIHQLEKDEREKQEKIIKLQQEIQAGRM